MRQMLSRVRIHDSGDTQLLAGRIIELTEFNTENKKAEAKGGKLAVGERILLGITKVSLTTRSFLAAASFMETARVMIDAAVTGRADSLEGLKENVIIGRLIPVGTGYVDENKKSATGNELPGEDVKVQEKEEILSSK